MFRQFCNPWLLNCENGTLNLKTGRLQPFNSADFMTKCCKTKYDPNCPTPLWDSLMEKITNGNEEMKKFIQKSFGYALTGDISEQCIFILYGTGSNGKSTLLNVFSELMSGYAQSTKSETFMEKKNESVNNDIARLNGARFVTAIEMQENKRMSEELIKSMTGGDKLVTRFLYGEFFEYLPQFKVFLAANHKPVIPAVPYCPPCSFQKKHSGSVARYFLMLWTSADCLMSLHFHEFRSIP